LNIGRKYDKLGNKLKGTFKKASPTSPADEIYDKNGKKIDGRYRNVEKMFQEKNYMIKIEEN
jgi:hypothetical protein